MSAIAPVSRTAAGRHLLALAALFACTPALHAQTVTDTMQARGSYTLDGGFPTTLSQALPDADPVDVYDFTNTGASGVGLHSYGSTSGQFGSRSSGYGVYDVTGGFNIGLTITNPSATAQRATFSFYITPGMLSNDLGGYTGAGDVLGIQPIDTGCGGDCVLPGGGDRPPSPFGSFPPPRSALTGDQFVESSIAFDIRKNGGTIWSSNATLRTDAVNGTQFTQTGIDLYGGTGSFRSIAGGSFAVDLGVLAAGESITLTYDLATGARGSAVGGPGLVNLPERVIAMPDQWIEGNCLDCLGGGEAQLVPGETLTISERTVDALPSGSQASSGDPFQVTFDGRVEVNSFYPRPAMPPGATPFAVSFAAPVPEPSTWALLGIGLCLVAYAKRRRDD